MASPTQQVRLVATTLVAALTVMVALVFPLAEFCAPERPASPGAGAPGAAKAPAATEDESPFTKLVRSLLQAQETRTAGGETASERWWTGFWCGAKVSDLLIAVFALWFVVLAGWQGRLLTRAVDGAELSRQRLERAYVTAGPGARRWSQERENPSDERRVETGIAVTAGNYGKTPAYLQKVYFGVCETSAWPVVEPLWPNVEDITQEVVWNEVIPPAANRGELVTKSDTFSELDHGKTYVSFGKLVYSDVFHRQHWCAWKHDVISVDGKRWRTVAHEGAYISDQG